MQSLKMILAKNFVNWEKIVMTSKKKMQDSKLKVQFKCNYSTLMENSRN